VPDEKVFPEGADIKLPRNFCFPLGVFAFLRQFQLNPKNKPLVKEENGRSDI